MSHVSRASTMFLGAAAGFVASIVGLILVYIVSVLVIFGSTREVFATLLAALSYLPLMLIFVFLLPNVVLGILVGLLLAVTPRPMGYLLGFAAAALIGFVCSEALFSFVVPLIVKPEPGDFVSILSNRYLTGAYGVILGFLTSCFFRWFNPQTG